MAGFFDSDSEDEPSLPPIPPPLHGAGTAGAAGPSRRSDARSSSNSGHAFRQRLESTLSPSSRSSAGIRVAGTNTDSYAGAGDGGEGYDASVRGSSAFEGTGGGAGHGAGTGRGGSRAYSIGDVDMDGGTDDKSTPREPGRGRRDQGRILRSESGMDLDRDEDNGGDEVLEGMLGDEGDEGDDVRRLSRAWVKERGTQAIMQWEGELMDELFDKLEQQQKMVDLLKSDPKTSEEEHFKLMLVMTEMERVKYLVRSYVRTRLAKIERFSYHITLTPELHPLLSGAELSHAQRYTDLLHTHYKSSVLDSLPEWLRNMDDKTSGSTDMVPRPNPDIPVLIYCRRDCGEIDLRLRPDGDVPFLAKGSTHLVKYRLVERWIQLGWAEVL